VKGLAYAVETCLLAVLAPVARTLRLLGWRSGRVAILGWWGSETVGDVAILGQLLDECREVAPGARLTVITFDTAITRRTLAALEAHEVALAAVGIRSAWAIATSRCVIVGGGPLMESPSMIVWACSTRLARIAGAGALCYANGIGPVRTERVARAVIALTRASTHVVLRDDASRAWLAARDASVSATVAFDPAFDFVRGRIGVLAPKRRLQLALALRTPPSSYLGELDAGRATEAFLDLVAESLNALARTHAVPLVGVVMHDGTGDSDDHAIYARLRTRLVHPELLTVRPGHHTLDDAVRDIAESRAALTVRFHAMILALASGTPFVAVDYARPEGKVSRAAAMVGREREVVTWDALRSDELAQRLQTLMDREPTAVPNLEAARQHRVDVLRAALR
jgi:polysaccharide pyruvyl transferase WcaK-like protein